MFWSGVLHSSNAVLVLDTTRPGGQSLVVLVVQNRVSCAGPTPDLDAKENSVILFSATASQTLTIPTVAGSPPIN